MRLNERTTEPWTPESGVRRLDSPRRQNPTRARNRFHVSASMHRPLRICQIRGSKVYLAGEGLHCLCIQLLDNVPSCARIRECAHRGCRIRNMMTYLYGTLSEELKSQVFSNKTNSAAFGMPHGRTQPLNIDVQ